VEDSGADQHTQKAVQRRRVRACGDREIVNSRRSVGHSVGYAERCDHVERLYGETGVQHLQHSGRRFSWPN
jgi:hypothetical protein